MRCRLGHELLVATLLAGFISAVLIAAPATASVAGNAANAVSYANQNGYRSSIGVLDTSNGSFSGAGDYNSAYASESVMKVFIATRLLLTGQMSGWNETTAYKMITQSDDASANALYGRTGGDGVITWIKQVLDLPNLGSPPPRAGWWGGTQINARGMSQFYNAIKRQPKVWPWLGNAMHHATQYGSDGTYQFFGIPSATSGAAVKQGWGADDPAGQPAFNSTGFVNGDRYVVVILTQGGAYGSPISNMLTAQARRLMPGGRIQSDDPDGTIDSVTAQGNQITVRGWSFDRNSPSSAIKMVIYVNGKLAAYGPSTLARPDVNAVFRITGTHGYSFALRLPDGTNTLCVYATNIGAGANATLGCRTVRLSGDPVGRVDGVALRGNAATIHGWTYDYDAPSAALQAVVHRNGALVAYATTALTRSDVNAAYHITGTHGFSFTLGLPDGRNTLCVYGINRGTGHNSTLGCPVVSVSGNPLGRIDTAAVSNGVATVDGWAYDYDQPASSIRVVLYLNGRLAAYRLTDRTRTDVNTAQGISGTHGYAFSVPVARGTNQLCMYAINVGAGSNSQLGCRSVTG
jgi:hypothetical protein